MKPQYTWYEKIYLAFYKRAQRISNRIEEREEERRKTRALGKNSIIRCTCAKCLKVNPEGRLWSVVSYEEDCDQYKAFAADGVKTDLFCNVQKVDRDWFEDGHFEVVRSI